jgi:hypothetical protein
VVSFLLDTNVVSEFVRARPSERLISWLSQIDEDELALSVLTLAELRLGFETMPGGRRRNQLGLWLENDLPRRFEDRIVGIDRSVANAWGVVMARARRAGRPMASMDGYFAATSAAFDLTLVTRDAGDFAGAGIRVLNPWTAPA